MPKRVAVVGGGLAGLSAAVRLTAAGVPCTLFEKRPYLGGRVSSFPDPQTGWVLDNGPHLLVGAYQATRRFLQKIGSADKIHFQDNLQVLYFDVKRGWGELKALAIPAPFHLLGALARFRFLTPAERLAVLKGLWALRKMPESPSLDQISLADWLTAHGQPEGSRRFFWEVLALAMFNAASADISLLNFHRVLHKAFFGEKKNARLGWATEPFDTAFGGAAETFLTQNGSKIHKNEPIFQLKTENGHGTALLGKSGRFSNFDQIVLALPPPQVAALLPPRLQTQIPLNGFRPSPIVTVHLFLKRRVFAAPFLSFVGGTAQWIFNLNVLRASPRWEGYGYSAVVSGAEKEVVHRKTDLIAHIFRDLKQIEPQLQESDLLHSRVVKERLGTYVVVPGGEARRPTAKTPLSNVFLAGGWTQTGLPDTIESAVLSGEHAAQAILEP